jgi:hypothetical protein
MGFKHEKADKVVWVLDSIDGTDLDSHDETFTAWAPQGPLEYAIN